MKTVSQSFNKINPETNGYQDRIFLVHKITQDNKIIGRIALVRYEGLTLPNIEYKIFDKSNHNKRIMSEELPKYLDSCRLKGISKLIAQVEAGNLASIKILEKNGFIQTAKFDEVLCYIVDLNWIDL
jgi:RimJ/RimL family protein N-acetyltransferase